MLVVSQYRVSKSQCTKLLEHYVVTTYLVKIEAIFFLQKIRKPGNPSARFLCTSQQNRCQLQKFSAIFPPMVKKRTKPTTSAAKVQRGCVV